MKSSKRFFIHGFTEALMELGKEFRSKFLYSSVKSSLEKLRNEYALPDKVQVDEKPTVLTFYPYGEVLVDGIRGTDWILSRWYKC